MADALTRQKLYDRIRESSRDEVILEEIFGLGKPFRKKSPQAPSTDFGSRAIEAFNRPLGVFSLGLLHRFVDLHPVANCRDFAEGHTSLRHAPRPRIHSEEEDVFLTSAKLREIRLVGRPGILERIVDVGYRLGKFEFREILANGSGGVDE